MDRSEIRDWLVTEDERRLLGLWLRADAVRREGVGDAVHLRGLVEFSSYCARSCAYCGLRAPNRRVQRYRMTADEITACAHRGVALGYGTVVLQSGEDRAMPRQWMVDLIRRIKDETPLAVTLSVGERCDEDWLAWREAGVDRYLLRFETSNRELYDRLHPRLPGSSSDRIAGLRRLREMGYEAGGGVMVGLPGQTHDDLANDIELFANLDLEMIGLGPYVAHPATPLGADPKRHMAPPERQVPSTEMMTYKALALARIMCPQANIPSTTALAALTGGRGRELGLERGANVIMPNLTPERCRAGYDIYPGKASAQVAAGGGDGAIRGRIRDIGRTVVRGRGDSPRRTAEQRRDALAHYAAARGRCA